MWACTGMRPEALGPCRGCTGPLPGFDFRVDRALRAPAKSTATVKNNHWTTGSRAGTAALSDVIMLAAASDCDLNDEIAVAWSLIWPGIVLMASDGVGVVVRF